jgi:hypothetical protein
MTDEELKLLYAVEDRPDERDFLWSEYCEWLENNKWFPWRELKVWNQYDQKETYKACSAYWLTAVYNWLQILEFRKQGIEWEQEDPRWKWNVFQAERGYPDRWASLQDMMKFFTKREKIDWYVLCKTAQECKNALKNWFGIYTGSSECSWSKTSKAKEFVYDKDWANHCFAIVDYDDNWLRAINSFWGSWWDKGWFYIPDECYKYLFSTYVIVDHDDTGRIDEMRYEMEYNESIKVWITNWTRPNDNLTRKEWAVMNYRVYKLLKS